MVKNKPPEVLKLRSGRESLSRGNSYDEEAGHKWRLSKNSSEVKELYCGEYKLVSVLLYMMNSLSKVSKLQRTPEILNHSSRICAVLELID